MTTRSSWFDRRPGSRIKRGYIGTSVIERLTGCITGLERRQDPCTLLPLEHRYVVEGSRNFDLFEYDLEGSCGHDGGDYRHILSCCV